MIVPPDPSSPPLEPTKPRPPQSEHGPRCIIVASGPSALGFHAPRGVPTIAVNGAIDWLDRATFFHTTDWSSINQRRLREQRAGTVYTAAYPPTRQTIPGVRYFRRGEEGKVPPPGVRTGTRAWQTWRWQVQLGLSEDPGVIHVGNSAYGALGLAYHLGFTRVALIGVDCVAPYRRVGGGSSGSLAHVPVMFASARKFVDITSCGYMKATGIRNTSVAQWLKETAQS